MGAVAPGRRGQVGAVVQQESDAAALRDRAQPVDGPAPGIVRRLLQPQLHGRHVASVERRRQRVGERRVGRHRRDQVETAALAQWR